MRRYCHDQHLFAEGEADPKPSPHLAPQEALHPPYPPLRRLRKPHLLLGLSGVSGLRSYRPMRTIGKRAFLPSDKPLPPGPCTWCGEWTLKLERDHVLPRDLFPGPHRDDPPNLVPSCHRCNRKRADGTLKPDFTRLPRKSQAFCLAWWRPARLARHFRNVPDDAEAA